MKSSFAQTLAYFGTVVIGQLVSFLLLPLLTHHLEPSAYGEYALGLTVSGFIGVLGSASVRNVAFRLYFDAKSRSEGRSFYCNIALLQAILLCCCYLLLLVATRGRGLVGISNVTLVAAGVAGLATDFYALNINLLRAENQTFRFVLAEISGALIRLGATGFALIIGLRSPTMLFLASALAVGVPGIYASYALMSSTSGAIRYQPALLRAVARLGVAAIPLSLGGWIMALSDRLILQHYVSTVAVGIYSAGYSLADRLVSGIVSAVFMMGWPQILDAWVGGGKGAAISAIRSVLRLYLWLTVGPLAFLILFHRDLLAWLTGPAYAGAGDIVPWVALAAWVSGLTTYLNRPLELQRRYGVMSGLTIGAALTNVALNLVLVPQFGATGAAVSTLIAYVAGAVLFVAVADRSFIQFPYADLAASVLVAVFAGGLSFLAGTAFLVRASVFMALYLTGPIWFLVREAKDGFSVRSIVAQLGGRRS